MRMYSSALWLLMSVALGAWFPRAARAADLPSDETAEDVPYHLHAEIEPEAVCVGGQATITVNSTCEGNNWAFSLVANGVESVVSVTPTEQEYALVGTRLELTGEGTVSIVVVAAPPGGVDQINAAASNGDGEHTCSVHVGADVVQATITNNTDRYAPVQAQGGSIALEGYVAPDGGTIAWDAEITDGGDQALTGEATLSANLTVAEPGDGDAVLTYCWRARRAVRMGGVLCRLFRGWVPGDPGRAWGSWT